MKKLFSRKGIVVLSLIGMFSLLIGFSTVTEASELDSNTSMFDALSPSLYTEVSPDELVIKDENGTLLDPSEFVVYEKINLSRRQVISKSYSVQRTNYHGFFSSSIYVNFKQGYNWSGTLYFVNGGKAWGQSFYWALYSGTVYSTII